MISTRSHSVFRQLESLWTLGVVSGLTDAQLLERVAARRDGSTEPAFRALVERHGPLVLRVCQSVLSDPNDAEDAFQETFLVLLRKAASVRKRESLKSWLHGVAFRAAAGVRSEIARRRANERRAAEHSRVDVADTGPDDLAHLVQDEIRWLTFLDPADNPGKGPGPEAIALTSPDGTFRLGPVPEGGYIVTGLVNEPRAIGTAKVKTGQTGAIIRLGPDPAHQ